MNEMKKEGTQRKVDKKTEHWKVRREETDEGR